MQRLTLAERIERNWYRGAWRNAWLLPLWALVALVVFIKRQLFLAKNKTPNPVPVLVVGNINIGGTGKTPLIVYLVERARALNINAGIVSRGYGGTAQYPLLVDATTPVQQAGDEPRLLQSRLNCPVVVDPKRANAVQELAKQGVDLILSDDGLQHYAMAREAEIIVVDGKRRFGNGWLLPIGPLREPVSRSRSADLVLINGADFVVQATALVNAKTGAQLPLEHLREAQVDAVAGIGNPERFYQTLAQLGAEVSEHSFADHYAFSEQDFSFASRQRMLVMTEKDWVKCREFADDNWWYLQVNAVPTAATVTALDQLLQRLVKTTI